MLPRETAVVTVSMPLLSALSAKPSEDASGEYSRQANCKYVYRKEAEIHKCIHSGKIIILSKKGSVDFFIYSSLSFK